MQTSSQEHKTDEDFQKILKTLDELEIKESV
jgi:hypothetical protein